MSYLLIIFIIVVVLSPLVWLKGTPAQRRMTEFRRQAALSGLKVQLVPEPDAEESEKRPSAVRYVLPFRPGEVEAFCLPGTWTLLRNSRRGWESPWDGWRWFRGEAAPVLLPRIETVLSGLPEMVYAIRADRLGIAFYLTESGDAGSVELLADRLKGFVAQ